MSGHYPPQSPPVPSKADIGFSAPHHPAPPRLTHSDSMPNFNQSPAAAGGRMSTPNSGLPPGRRPPNAAAAGGGGNGMAAPRPPHKDSSAPASAPPSAAASKPKPPGSGPKTFEEMGVPAQKREEECVVM